MIVLNIYIYISTLIIVVGVLLNSLAISSHTLLRNLLHYYITHVQCWSWQNGNFHSNWRLVRTWSENRICRYYGVCSNDEKRSNEYDSN